MINSLTYCCYTTLGKAKYSMILPTKVTHCRHTI